LLVVGRRGPGALTGMLVGSVSMHCVTNAACCRAAHSARRDQVVDRVAGECRRRHRSPGKPAACLTRGRFEPVSVSSQLSVRTPWRCRGSVRAAELEQQLRMPSQAEQVPDFPTVLRRFHRL